MNPSGKPRPHVPASGIKAAVGESLGLQLYVALSRAVDLHAVKANLPEHRAYLRDLEDSGTLFAAGPIWTSDGESFEGDGLLIYRAASAEDARRVIDRDPMHLSGARSYELLPWLLNDGALNLRVLLSRQLRFVE